MSRAELLLQAPGLGLVRCGDVLVQVRSGPLTEEGLERIASHMRALVAGQPGPCGFLSVVEDGAPMADSSLRRRQQALVSEGLAGADARVAVVHEGTGVTKTLFRAAARMVLPGHSAIRFASDVREAIQWLRGHVRHAHGADLLEAVELARRAAHAPESKLL